MPRHTLDESRLHPAIADRVTHWQVDIVRNVQSAVASNAVLVVGMAQNPFCGRARKRAMSKPTVNAAPTQTRVLR